MSGFFETQPTAHRIYREDNPGFDNRNRNVPAMAPATAPAGLVRPNNYRTTAPAPAPEPAGWAVVEMDTRGGWAVVHTGTLDGCTGNATARANHPANRGTGRTFAVILSEGAAAIAEKLKA